jgi:3-hydroxymyristoyl/3-hydroxydecanoyl-(acyl carrier protein) dehydratase
MDGLATGLAGGPGLNTAPLDRTGVLGLMPHAPGWVFVDRVVECRPPGLIVTQKYVSEADPFVVGHYLGGPAIFPGVLLVEYVSQSAYLLGRLTEPEPGPAPPVRLLARCSASFLSAAYAGDLLTAEVTLEDCVRDVAIYEGVVRCGPRLVCRVKVYGAPAPDTVSPGPGALAPGLAREGGGP